MQCCSVYALLCIVTIEETLNIHGWEGLYALQRQRWADNTHFNHGRCNRVIYRNFGSYVRHVCLDMVVMLTAVEYMDIVYTDSGECRNT